MRYATELLFFFIESVPIMMNCVWREKHFFDAQDTNILLSSCCMWFTRNLILQTSFLKGVDNLIKIDLLVFQIFFQICGHWCVRYGHQSVLLALMHVYAGRLSADFVEVDHTVEIQLNRIIINDYIIIMPLATYSYNTNQRYLITSYIMCLCQK